MGDRIGLGYRISDEDALAPTAAADIAVKTANFLLLVHGRVFIGCLELLRPDIERHVGNREKTNWNF